MHFFQTILAFLKDSEDRELLITTIVIFRLGSTAYHYVEGWSWFNSFYFSVVPHGEKGKNPRYLDYYT